MSKEDWIILRLILLAYKCDKHTALTNRDYAGSLQHLVRKYGDKTFEYINQLNKERSNP